MSDWYEENYHPHWRQRFEVERYIYRGRTQYQEAIIFQSPVLGRVLVLDGIVATDWLWVEQPGVRVRARTMLYDEADVFAALRPGAPVMQPPGCVLLPHIYRLRMGVR